MERVDGLDFEGVKGVRKPRTFSSRKPRSGGSHTSFFNEHEHSSPSSSPPSAEKTANGNSGKYSDRFQNGDEQRRRLGNGNYRIDAKVNYRKGGGDERGDNAKWGMRSPDDKVDRLRRCDKIKESREGEEQQSERERGGGRFGETFKRKKVSDEFDNTRQSHESADNRHTYPEKSDRRDRDRDRDRNHEGQKMGSISGSSHSNVNGNGRYSEERYKSSDWRKISGRASDSGHPRAYEERREAKYGDARHSNSGKSFDSKDNAMGSERPLSKSEDMLPVQNKSTKVRLKVGGVTHTIQSNSSGNGGNKSVEGSTLLVTEKNSTSTDVGRRRQRLILQANSDDEDDYPAAELAGRESPKKEIPSNTSFLESYHGKEDQKSKRISDEGYHVKQAEVSNNVAGAQGVRKSLRTPKRKMLDGEYEEDYGEEWVHRKTTKASKKKMHNPGYDELNEDGMSNRRSSRPPKSSIFAADYDNYEYEDDKSRRQKKKSRYEKDSEDLYEEDEGASGYDDAEDFNMDIDSKKVKTKKIDTANFIIDNKKEAHLTARQKALQSFKEAEPELGTNLVEFPEGLPEANQKKKKEKLSDIDQQLKRAEAAQKRKIQVEKANNAIQEEAIKKILGQDSAKKKREDIRRKKRDEKANEDAANSMLPVTNSIKWVMGPTGTTVSFSEDAGLPSIFQCSQTSYPPEREKCAGPSCNNKYKYRDSKSKLPLCSLQCYRAINGSTQPVSTF